MFFKLIRRIVMVVVAIPVTATGVRKLSELLEPAAARAVAPTCSAGARTRCKDVSDANRSGADSSPDADGE